VSTRAASRLAASAEYGARNTAFAALSGGLAGDTGFLGGSASRFSSDGVSSAANGSEADGFGQWAANGQGRLYLSDDFELFVRGRFAGGRAEIDGFPAPAFTLADTAEYQQTRQRSGAAGAVYDSGALFLSASYSLADTERETYDSPSAGAANYTTDGHSERLQLTGEWRPIGPLLVDFGGSWEWTRFATLFDAPRQTHSAGAYAQLGIEHGPLSAHAGLRQDDHARFGGATSFGADASYEVAPDVRLRVSLGEGFKAPTLFQLYSDYGNAALAPERSSSTDLGLAWHDRGTFPYAGVTLFRRESDNLIGFVSCFGSSGGICAGRPYGTYDNIGRVRAQGIELEAGHRLAAGLSARLAYSFVDSVDRTPGSAQRGNLLARRPRHALTLGGEWETASGGPVLGADLRWVSHAFDDDAGSVRLPAYATLDLTARWPVSERIELYGRIENLWDEDYQTAAGYASPGRGAFFGARVRL
jgi:vitamin B12 transporter